MHLPYPAPRSAHLWLAIVLTLLPFVAIGCGGDEAKKSAADAERIARAMSQASGTFRPDEWETIAKKLQSRTVQARIRLLL